jgi:hypothetical protein
MASEQLQPLESAEGTAPGDDRARAGASLAPVAMVPESNAGERSADGAWQPEAGASPRAFQAILLAGAAVAATAFWLRPTPPRLLRTNLRELAFEAAAAAAPRASTVRDGTTRVRHVRTTMTHLPSSSELLGDRPAAHLTDPWPPPGTSPARLVTESPERP